MLNSSEQFFLKGLNATAILDLDIRQHRLKKGDLTPAFPYLLQGQTRLLEDRLELFRGPLDSIDARHHG